MSVGRFLGMVGALIWCQSIQKYLILKRSEDKDFASNVWECGTGRVDQGENYSQALLREVHEEIGIEIQVDLIIGTAHFYRGEKIKENEMIGVFYLCSLDDPDSIQLSWEHSQYRWVTPDQVKELLPEDHWLVRLIQRGDYLRLMMPPEVIDYHQIHGLEV